MGECSAYSSLQVDSKVKFAAWPTSWRPPYADRLSLRGPKVNSRIWLRTVDGNTINIVLCIIILLILYCYYVLCAGNDGDEREIGRRAKAVVDAAADADEPASAAAHRTHQQQGHIRQPAEELLVSCQPCTNPPAIIHLSLSLSLSLSMLPRAASIARYSRWSPSPSHLAHRTAHHRFLDPRPDTSRSCNTMDTGALYACLNQIKSNHL